MIAELEKNDWQRPADSLPDEMWDVVIIGAGPAGSMAAINLASHGHRVLLMDKERFPRDKACGDGLVTDTIRCLQRVGLYEKVREIGHEVVMLSTFSPSRIEIQTPVNYLTLKRRILDSLIARKAVDSGAIFCHGNVDGISVEPDGSVICSISGHSRTLRARVGVIATGANVSLSRKLGMITRQKATAVAIRCYARSALKIERMVISYMVSHDNKAISGYAWIFPMGNDEYNIGCGVLKRCRLKENINLRKAFDSFIAGFPLAQELMQNGEIISPLRGAMLRCGLEGSRPMGAGNLLAIGETIGSTYPFTGAGIGKAMETGELAAAVIHQALDSGDFDRLKEFPVRLRKELKPRYVGYQAAENRNSKPWLNDLIARRAGKSQFLRDSLAGINNETVDPRKVFSLRGVIKSFLK